MIKLPKEEDVISKLRNDILEYHLTQLNSKTGRIKELSDYQQLLSFIKNNWLEENLNWFSLMTAFLNQLLKGDNNKAKDAFQNQALASIQLKLDNFEQYANACISRIGEERFNSFEKALFDEISEIKDSLSVIHRKQNENLKVASNIDSRLDRIEKSRQLDLNVFEKYRKLLSDIDAMRIEISSIEVEKKETLEFIAEEENNRKKDRFERDYVNLKEQHLRLSFEIVEKQKELNEYKTNIQRVWISVNSENSPRLIEARQALENGDIDGANGILDDNALQQDFEHIKNTETVLKLQKESLAKEFITKGEIIAIEEKAHNWFEEANNYFKIAIELSPTFEIYFKYAEFSHMYTSEIPFTDDDFFTRSENLYKISLKLSKNEENKITTLIRLGDVYSDCCLIREAQQYYNEAIENISNIENKGVCNNELRLSKEYAIKSLNYLPEIEKMFKELENHN